MSPYFIRAGVLLLTAFFFGRNYPNAGINAVLEGQLMTIDTAKKMRMVKKEFASSKDPVCGMSVIPFLKDTAHMEKRIYGFCSLSCKLKFKKDSGKYLKK